MPAITQNPVVSLEPNQGAPQLFYLADGAAIFGCIGSPEGVILANARSIAVTELGAIYVKTTNNINTGWVLISGGGGSGTVTSVGLTAPSALFVSPVSGSPVTTSGTLALALASQSQNLFFASPNGSAGTPTFRAIANGDISAAVAALLAVADPPSNSVQFNNGSNLLQGEPDFTYDAATGTILLGVAAGLSGQLDFRNTNAARIRFKTNNPSSYDLVLPDTPGTALQVLRVASVLGSVLTLDFATMTGGTVTSFSAGDLSPLFTSNVATATTTPALTFAQVSQSQNLFFASPNGSAGNPTFRAIATADLAAVALADPPTNSVQFNNGANVFQGEPDFTYDPVTATILLGVSAGLSGQLDFRNTNGFRVRFKTNNPVDQAITLPDALPTVLDLLTASAVSGSNVTLGYVARSSIGASGANPTASLGLTAVNGVATTFLRSDGAPALDQSIAPTWTGVHIHQISSANAESWGANGNTNPVLRIVTNVASQVAGLSITGNASGSGVTLTALGGTNENIALVGKGTGIVSITNGLSFSNAIGSVNIGTGFAGDSVGRMYYVSSNTAVSQMGDGFLVRAAASGFGIASGNLTSSSVADIRLIRSSPGIFRTSDGTTGIGQLQVAASGITQRGNLHVEPSANTLPALWLSFASATGSDSAFLASRRSRGSSASPAVVQDGDILLRIQANGQTNTADANFTAGGEIRIVAKETWSGSVNGAQMEFYTAPLGGGAAAQVGKWHSNGVWCVGANPTTVNAVNRMVVGNSIGFNTDVVSCISPGSVDTTTTCQDLFVGAGSSAYFERWFEQGDGNARGRINVNGQIEEQVGRSNTYARTIATWQSNITPTGNTSTTETTLHSYTIGGNSLRVNKDAIRLTGGGRAAANVNSKQLRFKFGATTFGDTGSVVVNGASFTFSADIVRTGAATQICIITVNSMLAGVLSLFGLTNSATAAETLSGSVTLSVTGQGGATDDLILDYSRVDYIPATI